MLARSHTDVAGFGEMSISYLKENLGITNFGVLFPNDAYGQGFQQVSDIFCKEGTLLGIIVQLKLILHLYYSVQSVLEAAAGYEGMNGISAQYLPTLTSQDEIEANIRSALSILKQSGCK